MVVEGIKEEVVTKEVGVIKVEAIGGTVAASEPGQLSRVACS